MFSVLRVSQGRAIKLEKTDIKWEKLRFLFLKVKKIYLMFKQLFNTYTVYLSEHQRDKGR